MINIIVFIIMAILVIILGFVTAIPAIINANKVHKENMKNGGS